MPSKLTIEQVRNIVSKEGYELLTTEYNGVKTKLKMICPEGHKCEITYSKFKDGNRCKHCYNKKEENLKD